MVSKESPEIDLQPVADLVSRHTPFGERHLIGALQSLQRHYGYLPRPVLDELARQSLVPLARIYGVATFYSQFRLTPGGKHTVRVCRGTACHVRGAPRIMDAIAGRLGVTDGETSEDGLFSLESVACLGTCYLAPVMVVDDRYYGNLTPEQAVKILEGLS